MGQIPTNSAIELSAGPPKFLPAMSKILILSLLFGTAAFGPWLWIHSGAAPAKQGIELSVRHELPGTTFEEVSMGVSVPERLGTTNLFNGDFRRPEGPPITAFYADWQPEQGAATAMLMHTPDVCWVQVGWEPVVTDAPSKVTLKLDGQELPFECRVFKFRGTRVLVVWLGIINGSVLDMGPLGEVAGSKTRFVLGERWRRARQLFGLMARRAPVHGRKQFVRYSRPFHGDWQAALADLQEFGSQWIQVREVSPEGHMP